MPIPLPAPIAAYFAADREDADAVARCFTETAVVSDERQTHVGRDAIRKWKTETSSRFSYRTEPFAVAEADGETVVTGHLTGDFPGSPIDLRYAFVLEGEKIARLRIAP
ncbi:nuclear transport factor 2 family protein [Arsenicitalea aurantiaca]|uniref:Nuclear transport factor 2 family protein n=1 Tax=Arsenicitalea aurantiaca TaxID=1783274 RepID=A0A433XFI3_9HYPH|nr:nuclear transport factor 2 family protein [Arsenicitalea aurantiaca]RUT32859.1 nuclear transport factor 2 family protein [Arsenicitalea aurantiaca]